MPSGTAGSRQHGGAKSERRVSAAHAVRRPKPEALVFPEQVGDVGSIATGSGALDPPRRPAPSLRCRRAARDSATRGRAGLAATACLPPPACR